MTKENLVDVLNDFFGMNEKEGSYFYELTRVKNAFSLTFDDFEEFNNDQIEDLADYILDKFNKGRR